MSIEIILIVAMLAVTYLPRMLPFALASRIRLPMWMQEAMSYVPIAVLTVIIVQTSLFKQDQLQLTLTNPYIWAAFAAFVVARIQAKLFITVLSGLIVFFIAKLML